MGRFFRVFGLSGLLAIGFGEASQADAAADIAAIKASIDTIWIATAAALVLLMQIGFMLLEGGMVRTKNSINVAQKNFADFTIAMACFALVGFAFMFGDSLGGWLGYTGGFFGLAELSNHDLVFFAFQAMFCGTAATIVSGAVAERFSFTAYACLTVVIALLVYPVFGHWVWGGALGGQSGWLAELGFVDFAGSTVVHSVGAWAALAAVLAVGPRLGRYASDGTSIRMQGHSALLATVGAFLLFAGWLGFNAGSTVSAEGPIGLIVVNTLVAGAAGAAVTLIIGAAREPHFLPETMITGLLGGLVAVTAGCFAFSPAASALVGMVGGALAYYAAEWLARRGIDDPVSAIATHGFAGVWGTLAVALFAPIEALPLGGRLEQLGVQALGAGVAFIWAFGVVAMAIWALSRVTPLRVSEEAERRGLNAAEHGSTLGTGAVQDLLTRIIEGEATLSDRARVEAGDESAELIDLFNRLLINIEASTERYRVIDGEMERLEQRNLSEAAASIARWRAERDIERDVVDEITRIIEDVSSGKLDRRADLTRQTAHLAAIGSGVNRLLDHLANMIDSVSNGAKTLRAQCERQRSTSGRLAQNASEEQRSVSEAREQINAMTESTRQTAGNASDSAAAATQTAKLARDGEEATERAVIAMRSIEQQTTRIASVVTLIDEIASKTNILAINAAVESARAGAHGAAFQIVAEEVRALATQTQEMAGDIAKKIDETGAAVREGVETVEGATSALAQIRSSATIAEGSMTVIGELAESQARQATSILTAIERIAMLSDQNADLARDGSALSEAVALETNRIAASADRYREGLGETEREPDASAA